MAKSIAIRTVHFFLLVLFMIPGLCHPTIQAQALPLRLSQYSHSAWRTREGYFEGIPNAVTQTTDGYLWIGTSAGLVRFDGVKFVKVPIILPNISSSVAIDDLHGARDGSLWLGTWAGLFRFKDNRWSIFVDANHFAGRFNRILEDRDGNIWGVRTRVPSGVGGICKVSGDHLDCLPGDESTRCPVGETIAQDDVGAIWVGTKPALCTWNSGKETAYLPPPRALKNIVPLIEAILPRHSSPLLVGFRDAGPGFGLEQLVRGKYKSYDVAGVIGSHLQVTSMTTDFQQGLWIGTTNEGLYHIVNGKVDRFGSSNGLSEDGVQNIFQDREGDVWVTTYGGLDRFRAFDVLSYSTREGLLANITTTVVSVGAGGIILGEVGGLQVIRDGKLATYEPQAGFPGSFADAFLLDHTGKLWVGIDLKLWTLENGRFLSHDPLDGAPLGNIRSMAEDVDHVIWLTADFERHTSLYRTVGGHLKRVPLNLPIEGIVTADPRSGVWTQSTRSFVHYDNDQVHLIAGPPNNLDVKRFVVSADGAIWAWGSTGLIHGSGGKWLTLDSHHGLPCNEVNSVVDDQMGSWWLNLRCGLVALPKSELLRWAENPEAYPVVKPSYTFDAGDGAGSVLNTFSPDAAIDLGGRLWLADGDLLKSIDPNHLHINRLAPPVHVEQLIADHRSYPLQGVVHLPALTRDIVIDYTALSLVIPEKVKFRYWLSGVDHSWQDVGTRRQAFYMNLKPGRYHFQVIACNNSGYWNSEGDSVTFIIPPRFYQTTWFLVVLCATGLLAITAVFRSRLRLATRLLESRLAERDRIARELHDTLLQGLQGLLIRLHVTMEAIPAEEPTRNMLATAIDRAQGALLEGRDRVRDLRSHQGDTRYLIEELERIIEELRGNGGPSLRFTVKGEARALKVSVAEEVLSFAREALFNAMRHSQGTEVSGELRYAKWQLTVAVVDNGTGISPEVLREGKKGHWGLLSLGERSHKLGAKLKIHSDRSGTRILLHVPGWRAFARRSFIVF